MDGKANKGLGQHFLVSRSYAERMVRYADIRPEDHVLEIGPGRGALTDLLVQTRCRLTAVEVDPRWVLELQNRYGTSEGFRIIAGDFLRLDLNSTLSIAPATTRWKLIANLPYNAATPILQKLAEIAPRLHSGTVMVQKEVAERILASAHNREIGLLTHLLGFHFSFERGFRVPPGAFLPPPKVVSMVIRFFPREPAADRPEERFFRRVLEAAFSQRRKKLVKNLTSLGFPEEWSRTLLENKGIRADARAENLEREDFLWLTRALQARLSEKDIHVIPGTNAEGPASYTE
jgi:16S rRNA (adenine1518-N6/adenine1519-N6)-dimethyltransferase